eukprot:183235-Chlamydomonas_euryale.AAC.1
MLIYEHHALTQGLAVQGIAILSPAGGPGGTVRSTSCRGEARRGSQNGSSTHVSRASHTHGWTNLAVNYPPVLLCKLAEYKPVIRAVGGALCEQARGATPGAMAFAPRPTKPRAQTHQAPCSDPPSPVLRPTKPRAQTHQAPCPDPPSPVPRLALFLCAISSIITFCAAMKHTNAHTPRDITLQEWACPNSSALMRLIKAR